mmetsp:Transcript_11084/g.22902  ORF Transcript_11084/g.22902 Transcript_11084/m.22902 type:complete len:82 (+) Transcript_11084:253-498(+)
MAPAEETTGAMNAPEKSVPAKNAEESIHAVATLPTTQVCSAVSANVCLGCFLNVLAVSQYADPNPSGCANAQRSPKPGSAP